MLVITFIFFFRWALLLVRRLEEGKHVHIDLVLDPEDEVSRSTMAVNNMEGDRDASCCSPETFH
jgi:hypothetical protein